MFTPSPSGLNTQTSTTSAQRAPEASRLLIRAGGERDVPDLLAMIRELADFENRESELEVTAASLHEALFGPKPVACALLAMVYGAPAGYAIYYRTFSSFVGRPGLFLEDLYVRQAYRKQGVGRSLMETVARIGARTHCGRFEWIALRWNNEALAFYHQLGARVMDDWVMLRMNEPCLRNFAANQPTTGL